MMIVAELRELLAGDEEGRLAVRQPLLGFGKLQRRCAHLGRGSGSSSHELAQDLGVQMHARRRARAARGSPACRRARSALRPGPSTSPASSSSVTRWTEQPLTVSPASIARACVSSPRYLGSSEGWMLTIRPRHWATNHGERMRMKPGERDRADVVVVQRGARAFGRIPPCRRPCCPAPRSEAREPRPVEPGGMRLVRGDQHHLVAVALLDQRAHVASATGNQDRRRVSDHAWWVADQSSGRAPAAGLAAARCSRAAPASTRPISNTRLARAFERRRDVPAYICAHDDGHSDSAIEGPRHFLGGDVPAVAEAARRSAAIPTGPLR